MRGLLRLSLLAPVVALACSQYQAFTPANETSFEPVSEHTAIPLLESEPDKAFEVIGYAECYAVSTEQALPLLQKQARLHGGMALLHLTSQPRYGAASSYRAAVIRYAEAGS